MKRDVDIYTLMEQADAYASMAMETLWVSDPGKSAEHAALEKDQLLWRLRIHYVFPQLTDWQRGLLLTLRWQRHSLCYLVKTNAQQLDPSARCPLERLTMNLEQIFMELAKIVREKIKPEELTPAQLQILEEEFLSIDFQNV